MFVDNKTLAEIVAVALFAHSGKESQPLFESLHFERDGNTVFVAATDRYSLVEYRFTLPDDHKETFTAVNVPADVFVKDVRNCGGAKKAYKGATEIVLGEKTWSVKNDNVNGLDRTYVEAAYPNYRGLFPAKDVIESASVDCLAMNAFQIVRIGKFMSQIKVCADKEPAIRLTATGDLKPIVFTVDNFRGLVMPVRAAGEQNSGKVDARLFDGEEKPEPKAPELKPVEEKPEPKPESKKPAAKKRAVAKAKKATTVSLLDRLKSIPTVTEKMADRIVLAIDRGDTTDAALQYGFGSLHGKRVEKARAIIAA